MKSNYDKEDNLQESRLYIRSGQRVLDEYRKVSIDGDYVIDKSYVYGNYIDEIIYAVYQGKHERYYHNDRQYNVRSISDWQGRTIEYYDYSAYGDRTINTRWHGEDLEKSIIGNAIGFIG